MEKLTENKQIFLKSIILTFFINVSEFLVCIVSNDDRGSGGFLLKSGVLFIIGAILYFYLKRNVKKRWRYLVNMALTGISWGLIFGLLVPFILEGVDIGNYRDSFTIIALMFVTSHYMIAFFVAVCFFDLIYNIYLSVN